MTKPVIENVQTHAIGFAPILRHYFDQCGIQRIIDEHVALDPRRKVLTHGQAAVAMITGILFQVMQLYRICKFASEKTVLKVMMPQIAPEDYFDDRLADTLDALFAAGIGNLELSITRNMIEVFEIQSPVCHNDTTSVSFYGNADNNNTGDSIRISFGHSKKHRDDLKQLVWSLSVSCDHAFPLFQKAYSGNTADVKTYVEQWHKLIDVLDSHDFLYIADSKLITHENMAHIADNDGFFIAPAPMYKAYKTTFEQALESHGHELLIPYKGRFNRGFDVPISFSHEGSHYPLRMIILFDHGLKVIKQKALQNRFDKTLEDFTDLSKKLNRYNLKTRKDIQAACAAILSKRNTEPYFTYILTNHPVNTYKNGKPGRPAATANKVATVKNHFSVRLEFNEDAFEKDLAQFGYYPLITNKAADELSIQEAMMAHKNQYKIEHTFRRSKGPLSIEPVYLHTPERIEAFLMLFKIALQLVVLIERSARKNIDNRDRGLDGFMPNRKDVRNPRTEYMLKQFEDIVQGEIPLPDGNTYGFVTALTQLQKDILSILAVPAHCYQYQYLFNTA
jgi:transposase